jgi:hypothetical protein
MKMSLEEIFLKLTEGATIEDLTGGPLMGPGEKMEGATIEDLTGGPLLESGEEEEKYA